LSLVAAGFGAFENGETARGATLNPGTKAGDWVLHVPAGTVMLKTRVLDVPTLDLGFSEQPLWWQQEPQAFIRATLRSAHSWVGPI
jgi:hypothetical protein